MARKCVAFLALVAVVSASLVLAGCVERTLTIKTVPTGSVVMLNDEEIGITPVTAAFEWYGDYRIRIAKPGYETLVTHKKLKRPIDDYFPIDFLATLWPGKIRHNYNWNFELVPAKELSRDQLLALAKNLRSQAITDFNEPNAPKAKAAEPNAVK